MAVEPRKMVLTAVFLIVCFALLISSSSADMNKDREECATQLVGLATCLAYVGGTAKAPTPDCCDGLKQVMLKSKKCLCVLVKDRDDPTLGLKINATLALGLPAVCKTAANISECPALLHLPPNSPDAKVFEQFAKGTIPTPTSPTTPAAASSTTGKPSAGQQKSAGSGKGKGGFAVEMITGVVLCCLSSLLVIPVFV